MGDGRSFKCSKCGNSYSARWGIGYLYPVTHSEEIQKIKDGEYGQEWKDLYHSAEHVEVDTEDHVYLCGKCGCWTVEPGLSLYVPNYADEPLTEQQDVQADEKLQGDDWSFPDNLVGCRVLRERVHKCTACGEVMHVATKEEIQHLRCPECGGDPEDGTGDRILWD
ncbi:MAG: hypothetical protein IJM25_09400 [Eubacterium sp.]|nr:hypothetical protein [Eubacterium sp.]